MDENLKKKMISLEQFIETVKGQEQFLKLNSFLTYPLRFPRSNKLEQLKIGKN